jgi:hypothetical protein
MANRRFLLLASKIRHLQVVRSLTSSTPSFSPRGQAVASGVGDAIDEAFRAELAEVVPKLAKSVLVSGEAMASDDACMQLAGRPVTDEATGMEQRFQQTDHAVIMQLETGDAALPDQCRCSRRCKLSSFDGADEHLGLFGEATLIGGGQLLVE